MAKRKARKKTKNDISMAYTVSGPRGMSRAKVYTAMIEAIQDGTGKLPPGVKVIWKWRNSKKQAMRAAPFASAIKKSRAGFMALMVKRIMRDANGVPGFEAPPMREATEREIDAIENELEFYEDKRESAGHRKGGGTRARETAKKRSAAAKKGWETRRAAAAKTTRAKKAPRSK
jgi:hypothetical protein